MNYGNLIYNKIKNSFLIFELFPSDVPSPDPAGSSSTPTAFGPFGQSREWGSPIGREHPFEYDRHPHG